MSLDGSFTCKSALERFLSRCPRLEQNPIFQSLLQRADDLTEEDFVNYLAEPFLHPAYTIPLFGCFRPLGRKIVEKSVDLLRRVPDLKSNSVDEDGSAEVGEDEVRVVEFYRRSGRALKLHEIVSLALCRALDLAPFLLRSVLSYFSFAPSPFQRILTMSASSCPREKEMIHLLDAVRVSFRFLQMEPKVFSEIWNWSCFLDLVHLSPNIDLGGNSVLLKFFLDIKWCAVQILSVALKMSDRAISSFGFEPETALICCTRWEDFCQDVAVEKASVYLDFTEHEIKVFPDGLDYDMVSFEEKPLLVDSLHSQETRSPKVSKKVTCDTKPEKCQFVITSSLKKSFEIVCLALSQKWSILLHGPSGSGKTSLINKLAEASGNRVLFLYMDEQMDTKALIGNYICGEQPGEFRWQPGSLTQALLNGFWVVIEDIDKAPPDLHSLLLPLLEGAGSYVTGHGEAIQVAESFRLFATASTSKHDIYHYPEGKILLGSQWRKVRVESPTDEDLLDIIKTCFADLELVSQKLIDTYKRINFMALCQLGPLQVDMSDSFAVLSRFSLRDLIKWCRRITGSGYRFSGHSLLPSHCKSIYLEAVDIFAASTASFDHRLSLMKEIAKIWGLPAMETENLYSVNKPTIQSLRFDLQVGRVTMKYVQAAESCCHVQSKEFVEICSSVQNLERIACSIKFNEPVLLVGETGTGKTTLVQSLAARLGQHLTVVNLSQQTDAANLLGGFMPTDARFICITLYEEFKDLFCRSYSKKVNETILGKVAKYLSGRKWKELLLQFQAVFNLHKKKVQEWHESGRGIKRKRPLGDEILNRWEAFAARVDAALNQIRGSVVPFSFVEGALVTAIRNGQWILLDEINLAPPETLQRIVGLLGEGGTLCLSEKGEVDNIIRHPNFRLFACMNPATDAGKKDLPHSIRSRFSEYFVDDVLSDEDLTLFVGCYMDTVHGKRTVVDSIVRFYKKAKVESEKKLQDGAYQKPQFSLRSLARALAYLRKAKSSFGFDKALYDGFCMFFLTSLDGPSAKLMSKWIIDDLLGGKKPQDVRFDYYIDKEYADVFPKNYVLTKSIEKHLTNLARAVFIKRYPVLLQGPTSSGKTSLVHYLAAVTGHEFVRINNHEHTDLQEYFGTYIPDSQGKLKFQEGALVKAVRNGHWIVLDELNLAPSDVLEALNRLLDDNRELFVPELLETIPAHPNFMLFATQNPPTLYAGRKVLSRAFRNRFLEIHVDEIPEDELVAILEGRCQIPRSRAVKMVGVMKDLHLHRQSSKVFAGKHGFMTPRDLFRWADRCRKFESFTEEDLVRDGYYLLAERLRDESEKNVVREILQKHVFQKKSRAMPDRDELYTPAISGCDSILDLQKVLGAMRKLENIICSRSMWRLCFLVARCYILREPVLLVGETGGGKTTICQFLSTALGSKLHILNCHQYTETSDFIGGYYPVRDRSRLLAEFKNLVEQLMESEVFVHFPGNDAVSSEIEHASSTIAYLKNISSSYKQSLVSHRKVKQEHLDAFDKLLSNLMEVQHKWQTIFVWQDGPLVQAMKNGDLFLIDEISLADDSVLERLNSVLEPERKLTLAEKGGTELEEISAHSNFFVLATMNPGGDYGKKELSPALRNRFTQIWVPPVSELDELKAIALKRLDKPELSYLIDCMLKFWEWFDQLQTGRVLTVRDLLAWVAFINATEGSLGSDSAFLHGAFLVLLDGLSLGTGISRPEASKLRERCLSYLIEQLQVKLPLIDLRLSEIENYGWGHSEKIAGTSLCNGSDHLFGITPFYISKGDKPCKQGGFQFMAPTTCRNALRVLRALQLPKPVLLEGSPGVGKTSLVVALAESSGNAVVRINLSEQTDIMDLLGSDLPVESESVDGMEFAWSDGILLQALKNGSWVLLDELNLAPQSVLEGLNAILDHRTEVYIPELGVTFKCPASFRVFACQNPPSQGGGRKGLPKSFLNRFTKVYVDELSEHDYLSICSSLYPSIPRSLLLKLICFNARLYEETMVLRKYGLDGSPWEFNLRDVIRSCQMIEGAPEKSKSDCFLNTLYVQRMRSVIDRREVLRLYQEVFGRRPLINPYPQIKINPQYVIVGSAFSKRNHFQPTKMMKSQLNMLPHIRHSLETALHCVQHQWLCIVVGPSSSGKTSMIRLLAQLTGNTLHELNLSSGTDISELLGCFEQYNAFRHFRAVIGQVEDCVNEYCSLLSEYSSETLTRGCRGLISRWFMFLSQINYSTSVSDFHSAFAENWKSRPHILLEELVEIIEQLKLDIEEYPLPLSWSCIDLDKSLKIILKLKENDKIQSFQAKFEWVIGGLVKAIECGEWVLLENANLCNPTVLDRINSLVEPTGSITVNECGLVDGKPVVLQAHPKFQLFITVNPKYGEISRAMRNRGVEVYMMPPHWALDSCKCEEAEEQELKRFLVVSGIPVRSLIDAMAKAHIYARDQGSLIGVSVTLLELNYWVQLFQQLLVVGNKLTWALHKSWEHIYLSSLGGAEGAGIVNFVKENILLKFKLPGHDSEGCSIFLPGGWPMPRKLRCFLWYSKEACVKQNCTYVEFLGAQCAAYNVAIRNKEILQTSEHQHLLALLPVNVLYHHLYPFLEPQRLNMIISNLTSSEYINVLNKKLFVAASWVLEQATESDLTLYLSWFKLYGSKLEPFCSFFDCLGTILDHERDHIIWKHVINFWKEIALNLQIDIERQPYPLLSLELVELAATKDELTTQKMLLGNSIRSVALLRHALQQWCREDNFAFSEKLYLAILPVFKSLRKVEQEVLNVIVESAGFDLLQQIFGELIEQHRMCWDASVSCRSNDGKVVGQATWSSAAYIKVRGPSSGDSRKVEEREMMVISWHYLKKQVVKLRDIHVDCVDTFHGVADVILGAIDSFLMEIRNLENSVWNFSSSKSLLWLHGGHPIMPTSAGAYSKMQELLIFCDSVWPLRMRSWNKMCYESRDLIAIILSTNVELKHLALQGVCMSSYITTQSCQDAGAVVNQLEEISQMLQYKKHNLEGVLAVVKENTQEDNAASVCCAFGPMILYSDPAVDCWLETLPLLERKSFALDLQLLQVLLQSILINPGERVELVLSNVSKRLKYALDFSLTFTSRPPTDFLSHQKIVWILDAIPSVDSCPRVGATLPSFVCEMWFKWHSSLWIHSQKHFAKLAELNSKQAAVPSILFKPTIAVTVNQILGSVYPIKDYRFHCLKLRVSSGNLWQDAPFDGDISVILLSLCWTLFKQIIFSHKKAFEADKFQAIERIFKSFDKNGIMPEELSLLELLIKSSNHSGLASLVDLSVKPLLRELYTESIDQGFVYHLGKAWLHLGELRFHLLRNQYDSNDFDPTLKYWIKYFQLQERISMIKLELEVREECALLAGMNSAGESQSQLMSTLENLEREQKRLEAKLVYRPEPAKYEKIKRDCADFLKWVKSSLVLAKRFEYGDDSVDGNFTQLIDEACNWQDTSTSFVSRLSEEYASFNDVIQPVQVAVFEMKLGLALVISSAQQKQFLFHVQQNKVDQIVGTVISLVRFPRGYTAKPISIGVHTMQPEFPSCVQDVSEHVLAMDVNLLKKLVSISQDTSSDNETAILLILLERVSHFLNTSSLMDKASFLFVDEIFKCFSNIWFNLKSKIRTKRDYESQQFKFRSRAFKVEEILEIDVSGLRDFASDGTLSYEWQEALRGQEPDAVAKDESPEEDWMDIEDSVSKRIVCVHNQLFGSNNLVEHPGKFHITDEDKLRSFIYSYEISRGIVKGLPDVLSTHLDMNLLPEHLFRVCVEYYQKFCPSNLSVYIYNFYKHPNAPVLSKMVKPLIALQQRVVSLLNDWPEHPEIQKIHNIIEVLLSLPSDTPIAKALLGLQLLVNRVQFLQESGSKLSISDQLQAISVLVSSWRRLEVDCWPALLDGILAEYEGNAEKLWFPLHSVLHREISGGDLDSYKLSTFESLKEFIIEKSSVGEFKKRLELILSFYGQFKTSLILNVSSCPLLMDKLKILYNAFGYYVQFLPLISDYIERSRRDIEKDLKELSKLSGWEDPCHYSKSFHQKLWKLVEKFNTTLQQPVLDVLKQDEMQRSIAELPTLLKPKLLDGVDDKAEMSSDVINLTHLGDSERPSWNGDWRKKLDSTCTGLHSEVATNLIRQYIESKSACERCIGVLVAGCMSYGRICRSVMECAHLMKHETRNLKKKNMWRHLLKVLQEDCGLSKHLLKKYEVDPGSNRVASFYLQPFYEVTHLLLCGSSNFLKTSSIDEKLDWSWGIANFYYYRSISMVEQTWENRFKSHKDLPREQVDSSASFLEHLVMIQQDQRYLGYGFASQLEKLRKQTICLRDFSSLTGVRCSVTSNQHAILKCMWDQKQLLDSLHGMSKDASLLLKTVQDTHSDSCDSVKLEAHSILLEIDKSITKLQKSKEALDCYLLGGLGTLTTSDTCASPFVVSAQMEQLVVENFGLIDEIGKVIDNLFERGIEPRCVKSCWLGQYASLINKGKLMMEAFKLEVAQEKHISEEDSSLICFESVKESFVRAFEQILSALEKLGSFTSQNFCFEESLAESMKSWKSCFENLHLDIIYDLVETTIISARKLINDCGFTQPTLCSSIEMYLADLYMLLDLILILGEDLLSEFVIMHKTVSEMTEMLASVFASIYLEGFGTPESHELDDSDGGKTQPASGTGMGEGEGFNDVSDQIDDEDQLLGTSEKPGEHAEAPNEVPGKKDKGIEMEEDFNGDTFSVSEDSGDDEGQEDAEDINLDSVMGEGLDGQEKIDEKLWDKEDGDPDKSQEKYEAGPSVREKDSSLRELRAKDDFAPEVDQPKDDESDRPGENLNADVDEEVPSNENMEEMKMDKPEAFEGPSGIDIDEQSQDFKDDMNMDEPEEDTLEGGINDDVKDIGDEDGKNDQIDEQMGEETADGDVGGVDPHNDQMEKSEMDIEEEQKGMDEPLRDLSSSVDHSDPVDSAQIADSIQALEMHWSNSSDLTNGLAPSRGLQPNFVPETEIAMFDSSERGDVTNNQQKVQSPVNDVSSVQRTHPNPYRSLGDALEEWKERIRVSSESMEQKPEVPDEVEDEMAEEYRYVSELEKGTSQALGPAMPNQIEKDVTGSKSKTEDEHHLEQGEDPVKMEIEKEDAERHQMKKCTPSFGQTISEKMKDSVGQRNDSALVEEAVQVDELQENRKGDLVSLGNFSKGEILQMSNLSVNDDELGTGDNMERTVEGDSTSDWRRYELDTLRLSQELAEQLRLVMEPTLASKLQGDYKTGKRINMKKVIPYIASHFRKDKIWLRRTRPNKRDYQVVVAVDDSRSMSENSCGEFARQALITVCRAMSQLEVGQLAAVSFGQRGNIRVLHDFHTPFTSEAGIKMIGSLGFKQENKIADAPIADLLKFLNNKLDASAAGARLPSGQDPLQQLILIIGDGHFHEQLENVKTYVWDALRKKRMVAFIILDSSIVDLQVVSFGSGASSPFSMYLDSFPFPYYIVLNNIEALPRTLSDLVRQWFELMQSA
ncbi:midasin isoform X2 [Aristolochia californica]|uniref:midasin isoform X2 n=1 Tax=Aristolochia californica TaxID=171875 RepID=UPI0035D6EFD7